MAFSHSKIICGVFGLVFLLHALSAFHFLDAIVMPLGSLVAPPVGDTWDVPVAIHAGIVSILVIVATLFAVLWLTSKGYSKGFIPIDLSGILSANRVYRIVVDLLLALLLVFIIHVLQGISWPDYRTAVYSLISVLCLEVAFDFTSFLSAQGVRIQQWNARWLKRHFK